MARTSWWRAIVDSAVAGPATRSGLTPAAERRLQATRLAAFHGVLAFAVVVLALFVGLRPIATELGDTAPLVIAAAIVSRALVALGLFGIGLALLRIVDRHLPGRGRS